MRELYEGENAPSCDQYPFHSISYDIRERICMPNEGEGKMVETDSLQRLVGVAVSLSNNLFRNITFQLIMRAFCCCEQLLVVLALIEFSRKAQRCSIRLKRCGLERNRRRRSTEERKNQVLNAAPRGLL